jgi:hypothetical protein
MNKPEHQSAHMQGPDAAAHEAFVLFDESSKPRSRAVLDERIMVCPADPSWPSWFRQETARLRSALPGDLVAEIQHIGSTAVPGLDAKPIVDLMVGIGEPGRIAEVVERLERLGYESLGEAGVPGRWALRKRDVAQPRRMVAAQPCRPGFPACECRRRPELCIGEMACRQRWRGYVARVLGRETRYDRDDCRGGGRLVEKVK